MNMSNIPSPAALANRRLATAPKTTPQVQTAVEINLEAHAKVRPGYRLVIQPHSGIFRAKHLRPGMVVRAWASKTGPRGAEKTVKRVKRIGDGSTYLVEFSSPHPAEERPAAYRFFCQAVADNGWPTEVPCLVEYTEA